MSVVCEYCQGTGQPNGIMGGPNMVCGYCLGTGVTGFSSSNHDTIASLRAELDAVKAERDGLIVTNALIKADMTDWVHSRDVPLFEKLKCRATAAEAQLAAARAALREARETILSLVHARWSECEGSDAEWVAGIDAALSQSTDPIRGGNDDA